MFLVDRYKYCAKYIENIKQHYYILDFSVLLENTPLIKFTQNYIWDTWVAYFQYPHWCNVDVIISHFFTVVCTNSQFLWYNNTKITWCLEDMNFFLMLNQYYNNIFFTTKKIKFVSSYQGVIFSVYILKYYIQMEIIIITKHYSKLV